ncbi:unnamed protein product [Phytomonas sp. EM1]|nr:unnamed protein product [Phytomonas sp. EM1]|eukprot:CCW65670.1 unnamed protein product [Phytomonas sp. isolate EM1]
MMRRLTCQGPLLRRGLLAATRRHQASGAAERRLLYENDSFLSGSSAIYIEQLYHDWKKDPTSVDPSWREIFTSQGLHDYEQPLLPHPIRILPPEGATAGEIKQSLEDCDKLTRMIRSFIENGHLAAKTNPLEDDEELVDSGMGASGTKSHALNEAFDFSLAHFGFSPAEAEKVVKVGFLDEVGGVFRTDSAPMTIRGLYELLKRRYCGKIGVECSHVNQEDEMRFIRTDIELGGGDSLLNHEFTKDDKRFIWDLVASSVFFEDFFTRKYSTHKRFGCDGAESLVVGLRAILETSASYGVEKINLGMAHRGRLNVLHNIIGKPFEVILKEFLGLSRGELAPFAMQADVKYHLGCRAALPLRGGRRIETEMLFNPSHLEAVNPVLQGFTAAEQLTRGAAAVLPIEIHGDASFAGQGVVYEAMGLAATPKLGTHGTIHVVCNNQIGFTTDPTASRSSVYCTDLARVLGCPVLHVNGDAPEAVYRAGVFAATYRARFRRSVVVDLVCYRRFGHNENDDPRITQPRMYARIQAMPNLFRKYSDALIAERVIASGEFLTKAMEMKARYGGAAEAANGVAYARYLRESIPPKWRAMKHSDEPGNVVQGRTAITPEVVEATRRAWERLPAGFVIHPRLRGELARRRRSFSLVSPSTGLKWADAEALAFAGLLWEGHDVRVIGRDVERGVFAHRHAVLHDYEKIGTFTPLQHLQPVDELASPTNTGGDGQPAGATRTLGRFMISNTPFNEYGGLGYAAGFALEDPNRLVLWEVPYGDLASGAAIVFDQFLSAGEAKWNQPQSCIVALPHGYDGEGPEHSSGRLERFLQMSSEDPERIAPSVTEAATGNYFSRAGRSHRVNWEIAFPTTPAQYFHLLRRQCKRNYRKPLILFFSKRFLDAPNVSSLAEVLKGGFEPLLKDPTAAARGTRRVVFCTGQIYHLLQAHRAAKDGARAGGLTASESAKTGGNQSESSRESPLHDIALIRLEELSPFPAAEVAGVLREYPDAELVWAQEEPRNMGAWAYVEPFFDAITQGKRPLRYVGRPIAASPATAGKQKHESMQRHICESVFED